MAFQEEVVQNRPSQFGDVRSGDIGTFRTGESANVFLQPVAPPSILGLFAFAGTTFIIAAWMAGWFGSGVSPFYFAPFVGILGGICQLIAASWSFRARDGLASAIHGVWGAFYVGYGLLYAMFMFRPQMIPLGPVFPELGMAFVVIAAISWVLSLASMGQRWSLAAVMMCVSGGATFAAIGFLAGVTWCQLLSGYLFILSSLCALYDAAALVLKEVYGHEMLKLGYSERVLHEPGIMAGTGEPGVIHGQR